MIVFFSRIQERYKLVLVWKMNQVLVTYMKYKNEKEESPSGAPFEIEGMVDTLSQKGLEKTSNSLKEKDYGNLLESNMETWEESNKSI